MKTRYSKTFVIATFFAFSLLNFPSTSHAAEMWSKLGRGVCNIFMSPLEIFNQYLQLSKTEPLGIAMIGAIPKGILVGIKRAGIGLYEVFTFPEPPFDKVYIEPEYLIPNE